MGLVKFSAEAGRTDHRNGQIWIYFLQERTGLDKLSVGEDGTGQEFLQEWVG